LNEQANISTREHSREFRPPPTYKRIVKFLSYAAMQVLFVRPSVRLSQTVCPVTLRS